LTTVVVVSLALVPICGLACALFARAMRRRSIGQQIRALGPRSHTAKSGTPTMGGLIVLGLWAVGVVALWPRIDGPRDIALVLASAGLFGGLGLIDDLRSIRRRHSTGLTAPQKMLLLTVAAIALFVLFRDAVSGPMRIPFSSRAVSLPPIAAFFLTWFVFVGTTNSMNLADGLDGLSGGLAILVLVGLIVLSPTRDAFVVGLPLVGALIGFLWINAHPAGLFLGDVGSFGIGGVVASMALISGVSFLLPILAGVLVFEAASVILQVGSSRLIGRRVFKMAPLHHHFEAAGPDDRPRLLRGADWPEQKVTVRFWLAGIAFLGLALWAGGVF